MDKTTLSKHRYIYEIYINGKNEVHKERHKVIYINKKYVYIARGGEETLESIYLTNIYEDLDDFSQKRIDRFLECICARFFLWNCPEDIDFVSLRNRAKTKAMEKLIHDKQDELASLQKKKEVLQKEIDALKAKGETL